MNPQKGCETNGSYKHYGSHNMKHHWFWRIDSIYHSGPFRNKQLKLFKKNTRVPSVLCWCIHASHGMGLYWVYGQLLADCSYYISACILLVFLAASFRSIATDLCNLNIGQMLICTYHRKTKTHTQYMWLARNQSIINGIYIVYDELLMKPNKKKSLRDDQN